MEHTIVKNPSVLSGEPVFRGTRVPFKALTVFALLIERRSYPDTLGYVRAFERIIEAWRPTLK